MEKFLKWLLQTWWELTGRCRYCGGETWAWDDRRIFCEDCNEKQ